MFCFMPVLEFYMTEYVRLLKAKGLHLLISLTKLYTVINKINTLNTKEKSSENSYISY